MSGIEENLEYCLVVNIETATGEIASEGYYFSKQNSPFLSSELIIIIAFQTQNFNALQKVILLHFIIIMHVKLL